MRTFHNIVDGKPVQASDGRTLDIHDPKTGEVYATSPLSGPADVDAAYQSAQRAFRNGWGETTPSDRMNGLLALAAAVEEHGPELVELETQNTGKPVGLTLSEEIGPMVDQLRFFAGAARHLEGRATAEYMEGHSSSIRREPLGVIGSVAPWNYPMMMAVWKIGPALAAGNAVVLKPARNTPLTALALAGCFVDAGLPEGVLSVLTGPGGALGDTLVADPRVRKVSFTGSTGIGERIAARAGVKKLSLELGASCPVVIMPDADLELASSAVALGGFANAGQVCISVQRVIAHPAINGDFLDALVPKVKAIRYGDPSSPDTTMGTVISTAEAERIEESIAAAAKAGARILTGGERDGAVIAPAVVADVDPSSPFSQDELFGPAVAVSKADDWESAIAQANGTAFGLAAGIFTSDLAGAIRGIREIDAGNIHINWTPLWRADLMPYGGLKGSGIGKEGPRTAVAEMTDEKTVVLHGRPW